LFKPDNQYKKCEKKRILEEGKDGVKIRKRGKKRGAGFLGGRGEGR